MAFVTLSILAGCTYWTRFAHVIVSKPIDAAARVSDCTEPRCHIGVHVDDLPHLEVHHLMLESNQLEALCLALARQFWSWSIFPDIF